MFQDMLQEGGDRGSLKREFLRLKGEEEISDIYVSYSRHSLRLLVKGGVTIRKIFGQKEGLTLYGSVLKKGCKEGKNEMKQ